MDNTMLSSYLQKVACPPARAVHHPSHPVRRTVRPHRLSRPPLCCCAGWRVSGVQPLQLGADVAMQSGTKFLRSPSLPLPLNGAFPPRRLPRPLSHLLLTLPSPSLVRCSSPVVCSGHSDVMAGVLAVNDPVSRATLSIPCPPRCGAHGWEASLERSCRLTWTALRSLSLRAAAVVTSAVVGSAHRLPAERGGLGAGSLRLLAADAGTEDDGSQRWQTTQP